MFSLPLRILSGADEVCKQPVRPRNTRRQLTIESKSVVHIQAFAITCEQQTALLRRLIRIVSFDQRLVMAIPGLQESMPALFMPSFEILRSDCIRPVE